MSTKLFDEEPVASHRQFLKKDGLAAIEWTIENPSWDDDLWFNCEISDGANCVYLTDRGQVEALVSALEVLLRELDAHAS